MFTKYMRKYVKCKTYCTVRYGNIFPLTKVNPLPVILQESLESVLQKLINHNFYTAYVLFLDDVF